MQNKYEEQLCFEDGSFNSYNDNNINNTSHPWMKRYEATICAPTTCNLKHKIYQTFNKWSIE